MSCGNNNCKSPYQKSCVRYFNNNLQPLATTSTIPLIIMGTKVVDSGISIEARTQEYDVVKSGIYHISADLVFNASATGFITLQVLRNGVVLPCTTRTISVVVGNNEVHTETDIEVKTCCVNSGDTFTYTLASTGTAEGNVVEFCSGMVKYA